MQIKDYVKCHKQLTVSSTDCELFNITVHYNSASNNELLSVQVDLLLQIPKFQPYNLTGLVWSMVWLVACNRLICFVAPLKRCQPSLKWLNSEALAMMGPYLSSLAPNDVDSSPKEKVRGSSKKDEEPMKLEIANKKIVICGSLGFFPSLSLLAVWIFPLSPVQICLKCGHQDEPQPGQEVSPKISRVLRWKGVCRKCGQVCIHAWMYKHYWVKTLDQNIAGKRSSLTLLIFKIN